MVSEQDGDVLHFEATTNPSIYKVVCAKVAIAHWLCCTLKGQAVTQKDSMANISFKSPFHQPMQQDWEEHWKRLAICDYDPSLPSAERDQGPIPSAFDRLGGTASQPQASPGTHGREGMSSSASAASSTWQPVGLA